jgi:thiamine pyrophosphate-dependent acetolactate synthase large subunit-like protein
MGLLSSVGLGLAVLTPAQRVFILEGDGSALMSLGTLPLIATERPANLVHIILDNEAYESTGAQPSISRQIDLAQVGQSCGYQRAMRVEDPEALDQALQTCLAVPGPSLLLVKAAIAPVEGVPRVSHSPTDIRDRFRQSVRSS